MRKFVKFILPLLLIVGSILVVVAMVAIAQGKRPDRKDDAQPALLVEAIPAEVTSVDFTVTSQGSVMPRTETTLVAEVAGQIVSVSQNFIAGGFFRKGEILLQIDPSDYETALLRAEATLAAANLVYIVLLARVVLKEPLTRRRVVACGLALAGVAVNDSATACMKDVDGDGYGDDSPPAGVTPGNDCDDTDMQIHPGAPEVANGVDDDGDTFGECAGDCDDTDPTRYPGAAELCSGVDGIRKSHLQRETFTLILLNYVLKTEFRYGIQGKILPKIPGKPKPFTRNR